MDEYLTPKKAAEIKGVSLPTIYKAIERGLLPSVRVLDRIALRAADLDAYQPGSYNGIKRTIKPRGPGRGRKRSVASLQETSSAALAVTGERTGS